MSTAAMPFRSGNSPVLVATSNESVRRRIIENLRSRQLGAQEAVGGADALGKLESGRCRILLLDHNLPDLNSDELLEIIESRYPGTEVVLLDSETGQPILPADYENTSKFEDVFSALESVAPPAARPAAAYSKLMARTGAEPLPGMIGSSAAMQHLYHMVRLVARRDTTVLITGETGTGKELVAHAIHSLSPRAQRPFITINCAAIPEALLEAELFGYTRGAFTGAVQSRIGRIHAAQGGTLFLDEIGELPLSLQAKILRFIEQSEVQRLGSPDVFRVDVRVVAATNAQLHEKVAEKTFREDLYYRLSVFPVEMPPLRERGVDVVSLAEHFLDSFAPSTVLSTAARAAIQRHAWQGNVRELKHVIERASILAEGEREVDVAHLVLRDLRGQRSTFQHVN